MSSAALNDRYWWLPFVDAALIVSAPFLASLLRVTVGGSFIDPVGALPYLMVASAVTIGMLWVGGAYRHLIRYFGFHDGIRAVRAVLVGVAFGSLALFAVERGESVSRSIPILHVLVLSAGLLGVRGLIRWHLSRDPALAMRHWRDHCNVLVLGTGPLAASYIGGLHAASHGSRRIVGVIGEEASLVGRDIRGLRILGEAADIEATIRQLANHGVVVHEVVVTADLSRLSPDARAAVLRFQETGSIRIKDLWAFVSDVDDEEARARVEATQDVLPHAFGKRTFDMIVSGLGLALAAPVMAIVAVLVRLDVGSPVLFWQERPGRFGVPFRLYKFRTMHGPIGSDGRLLTDAERVSRMGRFLRRTRLDELPQLYNIFVGDMSLVGPRPLLPVDQPADAQARLSLRPGLTGWAQVNGGTHLTIPEKAALDSWYARNASVAIDAIILARTVRMVLFGEQVNREAVDAALAEERVRAVLPSTPRERLTPARATNDNPALPVRNRAT